MLRVAYEVASRTSSVTYGMMCIEIIMCVAV